MSTQLSAHSILISVEFEHDMCVCMCVFARMGADFAWLKHLL